jgi:hypothetical protein
MKLNVRKDMSIAIWDGFIPEYYEWAEAKGL